MQIKATDYKSMVQNSYPWSKNPLQARSKVPNFIQVQNPNPSLKLLIGASECLSKPPISFPMTKGAIAGLGQLGPYPCGAIGNFCNLMRCCAPSAKSPEGANLQWPVCLHIAPIWEYTPNGSRLGGYFFDFFRSVFAKSAEREPFKSTHNN